MARKKPTIAILGAGNLARTLAPALAKAGYRVTEVVTRGRSASLRRAHTIARQAGARAVTMDEAKLDAGVVWFCVSDGAIATCARALSRRDWQAKVALHSSGALSSDELAVLRRRGAPVASLHPMMTFVGDAAPALEGVPFAVEGDAGAVRAARRIAKDLGGEVFGIRKAQKTLYHALGSFSSPLLLMLLAQAERVGEAAGLSAPQTKKVMRGIVGQTIDNYFRFGAAASFSGPLQRGDLVTIKRHLKELRKVPGALVIYRHLAASAVANLPVRKRRELRQMLSSR